MKSIIMNPDLLPLLLNITRSSAIACFDYIGRGDAKGADQVAVDAMRSAFRHTPIMGEVVIGEGERDKAPMLYIGEKVGMGHVVTNNRNQDGQHASLNTNNIEYDIAVDPLEGTNLCAKGVEGAIAVLALAEKGGLLKAPDIYMDKVACGPLAKGLISLEKSPKENIQIVAQALGKKPSEVTVAILDRPRHKQLIHTVYEAGARVLLIEDGDLSVSLLTCGPKGGVDLVMGIGGAPEGVLSAVALKCLGGDFQGRLVFQNEEQKTRAKKMGINDLNKIYERDEIAKTEVFFCATGVTSGKLLKGVKKIKGVSKKTQYVTTESLYMSSVSKEIHEIKTTLRVNL